MPRGHLPFPGHAFTSFSNVDIVGRRWCSSQKWVDPKQNHTDSLRVVGWWGGGAGVICHVPWVRCHVQHSVGAMC